MNLIGYQSTFHNIEVALKRVLNLIPVNTAEYKKKADYCDSSSGFWISSPQYRVGMRQK